MNLKTELVALAVRHLTQNNTIPQPNGFDEFFAILQTGKTHDVRTAEAIVASAESVVAFAKKTNTIRKFKKSIPDHV